MCSCAGSQQAIRYGCATSESDLMKKVPWIKKGKQLKTIFHGSNVHVSKVDPHFLQKNDYGWHGTGFYATTSKKYAKRYGKVISEFKLPANAKVLVAPTWPPLASDSLVKAIAGNGKTISPQKAKMLADIKLNHAWGGFYTVHTGWMELVNKYAKEHGFDAIQFTFRNEPLLDEVLVKKFGKLKPISTMISDKV